MPEGWEAIIGLEVHAQLRTKSKMFCACPVVQDGAPGWSGPNTAVCEICLAHPGTLPVVNDAAIRLGVRAALALSCTLHPTSIFARKHYFYPDLPKGYQISQFDRPLATGGTLHAAGKAFGITRIHLEEDAGKMIHTPDGTFVDWNRAGVPLVEIVSEAELRDAEEAEAWLRALHRVLVASGVCLGDMEKGNFRCDANVSLHRPGTPWGTKVEIKNVNSFRFVRNAIRFEIERQRSVLEAGGTIGQETRTWGARGTVLLRTKEGSADYRYFPEPDLPPLRLDPAEIEAERDALPGVPMDLHLEAEDASRLARWQDRYGLSAYDVGVLTSDPDVATFFAACVDAGGDPKAMANWAQTELSRRAKEEGLGCLEPAALVAVQALLESGAVNRDGARRLVEVLVAEGGDPAERAAGLGLGQIADEETLRAVILDLVASFPGELEKYRAGNKGVLGFFMGQVMIRTNRQADPKVANRLVRELLDQRAGETS